MRFIKAPSVFSSVELIGDTGRMPAESRQVQKGKTVGVSSSRGIANKLVALIKTLLTRMTKLPSKAGWRYRTHDFVASSFITD